ERVRVLHALDVAARTWIAVPVPRTADAAACLEHARRHAKGAQAMQHVHAREAGTDNHNVLGLRHPRLRLLLAGSILYGRVSQRPLNTGARFSTKARAASLWSSLARARNIPAASLSSPAASVPDSATFRFR